MFFSRVFSGIKLKLLLVALLSIQSKFISYRLKFYSTQLTFAVLSFAEVFFSKPLKV